MEYKWNDEPEVDEQQDYQDVSNEEIVWSEAVEPIEESLEELDLQASMDQDLQEESREEMLVENEVQGNGPEMAEELQKPVGKKKKEKKFKVSKKKPDGEQGPKIALTNRLNVQFSIIMTLIIALSIGISGYINYNIERNNVILKAQETNALTAINLSQQVTPYINNAINSVKTTVNALDLTNMSQNDRQVSFVKILNYNLNIKSLYMFDMEGKLMVSTKSMGGKSSSAIKSETWFKQAANGFTYLSDVFIDADTGLAMITISQPVENIFEGRVGVVAFDLRMDKFKEVIENVNAGETGHAYVLDKLGNLMAHRDFEEKVLGQMDLKAVPGVATVLEGEPYDVIQKSTDKELDYTTEMFSSIYTNIDGNKVIGGYIKIPKLKWSIVVEQDYDNVLEASKASFNRLIKSMVIFIVLGVIISFVIARSFTRPIIRMVGVADKIKDGDLRERIDQFSKSELGNLQKALNEMINSLTELINNINLSSSVIKDLSDDLNNNAAATSDASSHISKIIEKVAEGTQDQIASVESGNSAITQMSANLRNATDNSVEIMKASQNSSELAQGGADNIDQIMAIMESINGIFTRSSGLVKDLNTRVGEIGGIVEFIKNISDQTNLLALNASIEAARAGEHGRGFTVVANEVKKLADQSSSATEEIGDLIKKIQGETNHIVVSMESSMKEVQEETKVVHETADSFMVIINETQRVAEEVETFSAAMEELTAGMDLVENSMQDIFKVSDANSAEAQNVLANVEEQSAAIQHITESIEAMGQMASELEAVVKKFKLS